MAKNLEEIPAESLGSIDCSLVFFDLDGTLVNSSGQIHQRCRHSIAELQKRDIVVAIASGRPYFAARAILEELGIRAASMFFGGAMVVEPQSGQVLLQHLLSPEDVTKLVNIFRSAKIHFELYSANDCFVPVQTAVGSIHEQYLGQPMKVEVIENVIEREQIVKLVAVTEGPEEEGRLRSLLLSLDGYSTGIAYGAGHPGMLFANIASPEASRARCFDFFLDYFSVGPSQVMAFGDGEADIPFLERAGFGIAMGNAQPAVKDTARFVTASVDQQGVAYALERLCGIV